MSNTKIGICSCGRDEKNKYGLPAEYIEAILKADALPYILPPGIKEQEIAAWLEPLDIIVLSGGGDIDPKLYGEAKHESLYTVDEERDVTELALVRTILQQKFPTLAICRGMQMINVALGGTLYQHIPDQFGEKVLHRLPPRESTSHAIKLQPNSRLSDMIKLSRFDAPSWHHQAIKTLAAPLKAVAFADDGVIEAIEHPDHPQLIAVQWHPELSDDDQFPCEFFLKQLIGSS